MSTKYKLWFQINIVLMREPPLPWGAANQKKVNLEKGEARYKINKDYCELCKAALVESKNKQWA